jgi:hypothetical protein
MKAAQKAVYKNPVPPSRQEHRVHDHRQRGFEEEKSSVDFDNELLPRD